MIPLWAFIILLLILSASLLVVLDSICSRTVSGYEPILPPTLTAEDHVWWRARAVYKDEHEEAR